MGRFYSRRALRLLPAYYLVIIVLAVGLRQNLDHIWENVLYINNMTAPQTRFMGWSWSLAIEEQFYLVCPLLLLLVFRNVRGTHTRLWVLVSALAAAFVIHACIAAGHAWSLPYPMSPLGSDTQRWFELLGLHYTRTSMRFGQLLCGLIVAYLNLYLDLDDRICRMGRWAAVVALVAISAGVACVALPVSDPNRSWASWESFAYFAFFHDVFAVMVATILAFSLSSNPAVGLLNRFLSFKGWYPVAQLSYSAYLLNPIVIVPVYQSIFFPGEPFGRKLPVLPDWRDHWLLITALTLFAASFIYVLVERPLMELRQK